jgi:hypothetical protein
MREVGRACPPPLEQRARRNSACTADGQPSRGTRKPVNTDFGGCRSDDVFSLCNSTFVWCAPLLLKCSLKMKDQLLPFDFGANRPAVAGASQRL